MFSALIGHLRKTCTSAQKDRSRVKDYRNRFVLGFSEGVGNPEFCDQRPYRITGVYVIIISYIMKNKFTPWEVDGTEKILSSPSLGRCNQRGSLSLY